MLRLTQVAIYGAIALGASHVRRWSATRDRIGTRMTQAVGLLLIATAAFTVFGAWRPVQITLDLSPA